MRQLYKELSNYQCTEIPCPTGLSFPHDFSGNPGFKAGCPIEPFGHDSKNKRYIRKFCISKNNSLTGSLPAKSREGGFALVNIIVAILIFSILGAALVKILSSSAFSQVGSNSSMRAYYLAEGGYRYAGSQFLHAGTGIARDDMLSTLNNTTYTMANNFGSFLLQSYPWFYKSIAADSSVTSLKTQINGDKSPDLTIPTSGKISVGGNVYSYTNSVTSGSTVTFTISPALPAVPADKTTVLPVAESAASAQTLSNGGNLTLASGASSFPPFRGTFKIEGNNTAYAYQSLSNNNTLNNITDFSNSAATFSVPVPASRNVTLLKYLELHSTGTVGSGAMATNRMVNYRGPISSSSMDQSGGGEPVYTPDLQAIADASGATNTGRFETVELGGDTALHVSQTTSGSGSGNQPSTEAYVMLPSGASNPIYQSWNGAGSYLSYDVQVKVATGDIWDGSKFTSNPDTYSAGVLFRATPLSNQSTYYGLSYMRSFIDPQGDTDGIADSLTPLPPSGTYTNWANNTIYAVDNLVKSSNVYYRCISAHTSNNVNRPPNTTYWEPYKQAMIVLWTRNGNQGNGDDNWLAYKTLNEGGTEFAIDSLAHIKDWSTIVARVAEAASIKLTVSTASLISVGDTVTGGNGTATAIVYKKINDSDGNVVLLLNNVVGTFTRPNTVGTYTTDAAWGYRPRDNYIWAFYSDTGDHSFNATPVDPADPDVRLGEPRGTINWPNADVPDWQATGDNFTLVQWSSSLNTAQDSTLRLMGSGLEANAIIRTQKWTTGSYTLGSFPPEIGLVSIGTTATQTYFDDFSFYLRGAADGGTPGPIGFLPPIQQ